MKKYSEATVQLTPEGLHVGHRHPQYGELIGLAGQRTARRHHVRQLRDVRRHLVASPPFDLAVVLPTETNTSINVAMKNKEQQETKQIAIA